MWTGVACLLLVILGIIIGTSQSDDFSQNAAITFLERINKESSEMATRGVTANWNYESNITDYNLEQQLAQAKVGAEFNKRIVEEASRFPWRSFVDGQIRRQFEKLTFLGSAALSTEKFEKYNKIKAKMVETYAKATVCDYHDRSKCNLHLEPEISERISKSSDPRELEHLWAAWRNSSGRQVRQDFKEYVDITNEVAAKNNYSNAAAMWIRDYEAEDFPEQVETLWNQVQPMYLQFHAYVRGKLRQRYGEQVVSKTGPIPAHLLGNMWAQTWENIESFSLPYPNKPSLNVTPALIEQRYTPLKIFKLAEAFFTSLNLSAMPDSFWTKSILEKPSDGRDLVCHASAWDFYDAKDVRIKQCTLVTSEHLETAHHEMGHIQYFIQYKDQPVTFREGANPGFHEAVGDVMALSVGTPNHLKKINLLKEVASDREAEINHLYQVALQKIAFLPFGYLMDQFRWSVFKGETSSDDYNCRWWNLRNKYQGMQPPVDRTEEDFDAGAKYHIVGDVPYIRYFVSYVVQFQFHKALCEAAGQFDPQHPDVRPLHDCDIDGSAKAGKLLGDMLKLGSSKPWPDAMEAVTGQRKMDASAILQYFRPLTEWLEAENKRNGEFIGWTEPTKVCKK